MENLGSMQLLSSRNHVVTSLKYQDMYCRCRESQLYHYEEHEVFKCHFVIAKVRLRRVTTKEKKVKNWKIKFFPRIGGLRSNTNKPFGSTEKNIQNVFSNKSTEKSAFLKKLSAKNFDFRFFPYTNIIFSNCGGISCVLRNILPSICHMVTITVYMLEFLKKILRL